MKYLVGSLLPSIALVIAVHLSSNTWKEVRTGSATRQITVKGSATKRILSDLVEWRAVATVRGADQVSVAQELGKHVEATVAHLVAQGIPAGEMTVMAASTSERFVIETKQVQGQMVQTNVPSGWEGHQAVEVWSSQIPVVQKASRNITTLIAQGVSITSEPPRYHFTKLSEVKINMLAAAAADAKTRAERMVKSAGGKSLGSLVDAKMGVININPAYSTDVSWAGNNDKTSYEKDVITVVSATYALP